MKAKTKESAGKKGGDTETWTPERGARLTINGHTVEVTPGVEVTLPPGYKELYERSGG